MSTLKNLLSFISMLLLRPPLLFGLERKDIFELLSIPMLISSFLMAGCVGYVFWRFESYIWANWGLMILMFWVKYIMIVKCTKSLYYVYSRKPVFGKVQKGLLAIFYLAFYFLILGLSIMFSYYAINELITNSIDYINLVFASLTWDFYFLEAAILMYRIETVWHSRIISMPILSKNDWKFLLTGNHDFLEK